MAHYHFQRITDEVVTYGNLSIPFYHLKWKTKLVFVIPIQEYRKLYKSRIFVVTFETEHTSHNTRHTSPPPIIVFKE